MILYTCANFKTLPEYPLGVLGSGFYPLGRIGPQSPLLIIKGKKEGQRTETLYLVAVFEGLFSVSHMLNYHNKEEKTCLNDIIMRLLCKIMIKSDTLTQKKSMTMFPRGSVMNRPSDGKSSDELARCSTTTTNKTRQFV